VAKEAAATRAEVRALRVQAPGARLGVERVARELPVALGTVAERAARAATTTAAPEGAPPARAA
jgi:hypothetical protein